MPALAPMKNAFRFFSLTVLLLAFGCAKGRIYSGDPVNVSLGMTKKQVIKLLGEPARSSVEGQSETLRYIVEHPWSPDRRFQILLVNDRVVSRQFIER